MSANDVKNPAALCAAVEAEARRRMARFVAEFLAEWNGEDLDAAGQKQGPP